MKPIAVLMVDDNPIFLREGARFLQDHGYHDIVVVGTARTGPEALSQTRELRPDVILLDLSMPGMSGLDLIPHLRFVLPSAYVVVVTMLDDSRYRDAALAAGANEFVSKFAAPTELLPAIRRYRLWDDASRGCDGSRASAPVNHPTPRIPMKKHGKPITILMADDSTVDCLLVKEAIERARLYNDLRFVENGVELMDYLHRRGKYSKSSNAPRPGLILLDLNMPRKDGREALAEIKADPELRDIPVVVMTASKEDEDFWRARGLGASIYLVKPVTFEALANVVKSLGRYWFEIVDIPMPAADEPESAATSVTASPAM